MPTITPSMCSEVWLSKATAFPSYTCPAGSSSSSGTSSASTCTVILPDLVLQFKSHKSYTKLRRVILVITLPYSLILRHPYGRARSASLRKAHWRALRPAEGHLWRVYPWRHGGLKFGVCFQGQWPVHTLSCMTLNNIYPEESLSYSFSLNSVFNCILKKKKKRGFQNHFSERICCRRRRAAFTRRCGACSTTETHRGASSTIRTLVLQRSAVDNFFFLIL